MHPIDVVIMTRPLDDRLYLAQCIQSLHGEPVNLHFVPGVEGCIGAGRAESLQTGKAEYVAFVDPDDMVFPGIFNRIIPLLQDGVSLVYTDEYLIDRNGRVFTDGWSSNNRVAQEIPEKYRSDLWDGQNSRYMHHLSVFRRDVALEFLGDLKTFHENAEGKLSQHMLARGRAVHLPTVGYLWRIHGGNTIGDWR